MINLMTMIEKVRKKVMGINIMEKRIIIINLKMIIISEINFLIVLENLMMIKKQIIKIANINIIIKKKML